MAGRPKSGPMGTILLVATILAAAGFAIYSVAGPTDDPVLKRLSTPRGAVQAYIDVCDEFTSGQVKFSDVEKVVTKADYRWFQENKERIFQERDTLANISSAADPTAVSAIAGRALMTAMMQHGPYRRGRSEIQDVRESGSTAVATVRFAEFDSSGERTVMDIDVDLVKEGRYWRVKDFAGGRQYAEGKIPGNRTYVNTEELDNPNSGTGSGNTLTATAPAATPLPEPEPQPAAAQASPPPATQPAGQPVAVRPPDDGAGVSAGATSTLEDADKLIAQARELWKEGNVPDAFKALHEAYGIRAELLPPDDPAIKEVETMLTQANETLRRQQRR